MQVKKALTLIVLIFLFSLQGFSQLKSFSIDELLKTSDELFTNRGMAADTGLYALAESLYDSKKYDSASIAFSACLIKNPLFVYAYFYRGMSFVELNKLDLALMDFEMTTRLFPKGEGAYYQKGNIYRVKGELKNALNSYNQAISLDDSFILPYYYRVFIKIKLKYSDDEVLQDYNKILKMKGFEDFSEKAKALIYNNKSYILVKKGLLNEALQLVNKSLTLDNSESFIWDTRGEIYYKQNKFDECIIDMNKAIELDPGSGNSGNSYLYRGLAKIKIKQQGCQDLNTSLKLGKKEAQSELIKYCN